ncbi:MULTISPECIES: DUF4257 domain-containing protein [Bacillaceae]|uniref:DUF4257 domain-containing protein n=1 Tax=Bacillaceae TaxID=186817 RepID=UPI002A109CAE|nr:DUF4257 domain-containing protein [Cytobacillus sp. IB215316]MDX8362979.1 DUF4257 domain-containing protein [Cytobacillus sp. IB215316]
MSLLVLLIGSATIGGITGFVSHLLHNKNKIIKPRKLKYSNDLGFWADIIYGAMAAVFTITYLLPEPQDAKTLIAYSILAGISAQSVLLHRKIDTEQTKSKHLQKFTDIEDSQLTVGKKRESTGDES